MGNQLDRLGGYGVDDDTQKPTTSVDGKVDDIDLYGDSSSRKRPSNDGTGSSPSSSKKRARLDTAQYVYDKLFLQGEGSDITLHALGRVWNLHRLYIEQCTFFKALIKGNWKESNDNALHLEITDENITEDGLNAVLGSLYHNEIEIDLDKIEEVLAAAFLIGLDSVIIRCQEMMIDNMSHLNVIRFHDVSETYGLVQLQKVALTNLKAMFWKFMKNRSMLRELSESLFNRLLSSSDLLVVEGEMDLYRTLKSWIFLHENPERTDVLDANEEDYDKEVVEFLNMSPRGILFVKYSSLFASMRIHHFLTSTASISVVERDNLIPREVIKSVTVDQWRMMLRNEENPALINDITEDDFNLNSLRLGRVIEDIPKCWRWTGFNYGVDILLHFTSYELLLKRNCLNQSTPYSVNIRTERMIHYRVIVADKNGKCIHDSKMQSCSLRPDQHKSLFDVPKNIGLPFSVHLQYLTVQPPPPSFIYVNEYLKSVDQI